MQYRENFEIFWSTCLIHGWCMFQWFLKEYCSYGVETFSMYSYMIVPSAHSIRRYGHMRVTLDGTSSLKFISSYKIFWSAWVTHLGVTDGFGNCKLLVGTLHACAYQPCKNEGLTFNSCSILNYQIRVKYRENLKFTGQIALFKGVHISTISQRVCYSYGVDIFRTYGNMGELSAHSIRRYGRMRVILDGTSSLKFISNYKIFWSAWVTHLGVTDGFGNCKLLVGTLHACAYSPVRMKV